VAAGDADALVTAPVSKEALRLAGYPWPGQTEMLADLCAASDLRVLLMAGPLRVVSCERAPLAARGHRGGHRGERASDHRAGRRRRPATCSAARPGSPWPGSTRTPGEHGILGAEDERFIRPAVAQARSRGIDADGRCPRTPLFPQAAAGQADLVVAMYHDQGHIPVKLLGLGEGVAVTLGLAVSCGCPPDHGAAFDSRRAGGGPAGQHDRRYPGRRGRRPWSSAVTAHRARDGP